MAGPSCTCCQRPLRLHWLSNEISEGVLFEARVVAGFSQRQLNRQWDTIQTDKRIVRLAANGHTNASIAKLMSTRAAAITEGTIRNRERRSRRRIRRLLEHLLPVDVSQVEYNRTGRNHRGRGKRGNTNSPPNWNRKKKGTASNNRWAMTMRRTTASSSYIACTWIKMYPHSLRPGATPNAASQGSGRANSSRPYGATAAPLPDR
jgi:hypothetical protein